MNSFPVTVCLLLLLGSKTIAFMVGPTIGMHRRMTSSSAHNMIPRRKSITLPLLDLSDCEIADKIIIPLPSSHLPDELTTLNLYGMELSRPIHKMLIEEAIAKGENVEIGGGGAKERAYGHLVSKTNEDTFVGAIGCAAEVLIQARRQDIENESELGLDAPVVVLYRGCYRFVVKEVLKTIPYAVAIVDELVDDTEEPSTSDALKDYANLPVGELNQRIMRGLRTIIDNKLFEASNKEISPLEQSILESSGMFSPDPKSQREQAEESAAVFDVFSSSLLDIAPTRPEQSFAICMMAAEIVSFSNELRAKIISMTNSLERLQLVCQAIDEAVSMSAARKMADDIVTKNIEQSDEKDLQVGPPQLPAWASQIKKGTRVEYYWNDEFEWTSGEVLDNPVKIVDEYLINVKFDVDGEIHTLPLNPDEKVRWRPAGPKTLE